jgi:hypothetical protein
MGLSKSDFPNGGANDKGVLNKFYTVPDGVWGNIRFVHHGGAGTSGPGWTPENAYTTIDSAVSACTANNNDLVVVLPGHAETITAAAAIDIDVAGVTVMGLGQGTNRPTVTFGTATTATIRFAANNCTLKNIRCVNAIDSLAAFVVGATAANNETIEGCDFVGASTTEFLCGVNIPTTFDDWKIKDCKFVQPTDPAGTNGAAGTGAIFLIDSENVRVEGCEFIGCFETALVHNKTTAAANLVVKNCYGYQPTGTADALPFVLVSTATGAVINSQFVNVNETQVTEATLSGTFGAGMFNFGTLYGNDGGGGQLGVAGQAAAT